MTRHVVRFVGVLTAVDDLVAQIAEQRLGAYLGSTEAGKQVNGQVSKRKPRVSMAR